MLALCLSSFLMWGYECRILLVHALTSFPLSRAGFLMWLSIEFGPWDLHIM
nr:MAG TPA: virulence factor membrane-bound polymerase [Caudoviricetes sp.]